MENFEETIKQLIGFTEAILDSMRNSTSSAKPDDVWRYSSYREFMRKYNQVAKKAIVILQSDLIDVYDLDKVPHNGDTIAITQKHYFDSVFANTSVLKSMLENKLGVKDDEAKNLATFLEANLRKVIFEKPEKEIQVQNAIEQLFIGRGFVKGIDYGRETGRVEVSIKEVVPDFIMYKLNLAVEVKLSKTKTKSKTIVDEINADIQAYGKNYRNMIFVIYDLESIRDEDEYKKDLDNGQNIRLLIIKH
ncbi:MAG: hypothetical protein RIC06_01925 [Cyclobacteriaceae bacterium]